MIIRKITALSLLFVLNIGSIFALDVKLDHAGELEYAVENPAGVTTLTLSGSVNASDLYFIGKKMTNLASLDMRDAVIEAVRGIKINGRSAFNANELPQGVFSGLPLASFVYPQQQGLVIADAAFMNTAFTTISLPANVDSVGSGAFAACQNLTEVVMPDCKMGTSVFADCPALVEVDLHGVTRIPASTFRGCTALKTVKNAQNLVSIGARAFEGDAALTQFPFGPDLRELGESAFAASGLQQALLSNSNKLTHIDDQAFADAKLTQIELPSDLATIGNGAFFGNGNLESITLPAGTITLGEHSFAHGDLKEIILPNSLQHIDNYALMGQKQVSRLSLPPTLLYIGDYAMEDMTGLTSINAEALTDIPDLGQSVWEGVTQKDVTLNISENAPDFESAPQWKEFNIDRASSATEIIEAYAPKVYGRFIGTDLQLESTGNAISIVHLYDTSGRLLKAVRVNDTTAVIDTAEYPGGVFVVNIELSDSTPATLKLSRK